MSSAGSFNNGDVAGDGGDLYRDGEEDVAPAAAHDASGGECALIA